MADLVLEISTDKALSISQKPEQWLLCAEATTMCQVASGTNHSMLKEFGQLDPPLNLVKVSIQENNWLQKDKTLQHVSRMSTENLLKDNLVSLHIEL